MGWAPGLAKVALRVRDLYFAHLLVFIMCVAGLVVAERAFRNPVYSQLNLVPFNSIGSIGRALILLYQPPYFNILPLYVVLLMWLPVLLWLMRANVVLALLASVTMWAATGVLHCNLPNYRYASGWEFNPFAWQLLFSLGVISARLSTSGQHVRSRSIWLLCISMAYLLFAFIVAAPWTQLPSLNEARLLADFRVDVNKQYLSTWRLAHIAALGYMATYLVSPRAPWLTRTWARLVINCGQHSLPVFCVSIVLSLTAWVILLEAKDSLLLQLAVNIGGVALLGLTARQLAQLKHARAHAARIPSAAQHRPGPDDHPIRHERPGGSRQHGRFRKHGVGY
jgi:hypothetical protein